MGYLVGTTICKSMGRSVWGAFMVGQPTVQPMGPPVGHPMGPPMGQPANALGVPPSDFDDTFGGTEDGWGDGSDLPF